MNELYIRKPGMVARAERDKEYRLVDVKDIEPTRTCFDHGLIVTVAH